MQGSLHDLPRQPTPTPTLPALPLAYYFFFSPLVSPCCPITFPPVPSCLIFWAAAPIGGKVLKNGEKFHSTVSVRTYLRPPFKAKPAMPRGQAARPHGKFGKIWMKYGGKWGKYGGNIGKYGFWSHDQSKRFLHWIRRLP